MPTYVPFYSFCTNHEKDKKEKSTVNTNTENIIIEAKKKNLQHLISFFRVSNLEYANKRRITFD